MKRIKEIRIQTEHMRFCCIAVGYLQEKDYKMEK
jgi:hypothetical protein